MCVYVNNKNSFVQTGGGIREGQEEEQTKSLQSERKGGSQKETIKAKTTQTEGKSKQTRKKPQSGVQAGNPTGKQRNKRAPLSQAHSANATSTRATCFACATPASSRHWRLNERRQTKRAGREVEERQKRERERREREREGGGDPTCASCWFVFCPCRCDPCVCSS